ncbi:uncharacterized protein SCHCODRAFT_02257223 [Schizophyllum commune H4-8]|uniref:uncharacterized protein n=1 Tax=Schizophyllum commune (strain H4-8 / FGSC 9210) TaxID=578458 RepID=UPI00215F5AA4|nr:uncharacterized protein SCHCODRAFT_02257223 [Schizophyllum commune H4-8]KAI5893610.1 hypothetical protein SCHCODRAFT_02257223 [Schizophyllum commune H4-8]
MSSSFDSLLTRPPPHLTAFSHNIYPIFLHTGQCLVPCIISYHVILPQLYFRARFAHYPRPWPPDDHGMSLNCRCLGHVSPRRPFLVCPMSYTPIEPFDTGACSGCVRGTQWVASEVLETPGAICVGHSETTRIKTKMAFKMGKMLWRRGGKIRADSEGEGGSWWPYCFRQQQNGVLLGHCTPW